jgi:ABC-2 type transport system ATP-binding protein
VNPFNLVATIPISVIRLGYRLVRGRTRPRWAAERAIPPGNAGAARRWAEATVTAAPGVAIATEGLAKRYGAQVALDGLDLRVPTGVVYGFLGPNGAGKTTTMRILTGLIRPDSGRVELLGRPFGRGDRKRLFEVGSLIESPSFYPFLSGRENLRALAAAGAPVPAGRIDELLRLVNLGDRAKDRVSGYSLGMKQRLGIAAALLNDPKLLLLDEPANGLDPAGIVGMRDSLRALAATGKTVFVSSHILSEVQQLADVVGIVARGRLIREGSVESLLREEGSVRIRVAPDEVPEAAKVLGLAGGAGTVTLGDGPEPGWLTVKVDPNRAAELNRALAGAGVFASRIEGGATLESLFLGLTGSPDVGAGDAGGPGPGGGRFAKPIEPVTWAGDPGAKPETTGWSS